jgi:hypothetical protein
MYLRARDQGLKLAARLNFRITEFETDPVQGKPFAGIESKEEINYQMEAKNQNGSNRWRDPKRKPGERDIV